MDGNAEIAAIAAAFNRYMDLLSAKERELAAANAQLTEFNNGLEEIVRHRTRQLLEAEERYALSVRAIDAGIWEWRSGSDMYVSDALKSILGYEREDLGNTGEAWLALIHPDDRDRIAESFRTLIIGTDDRYEETFRARHKNGDYRWMQSRALVVRHGPDDIRVVGSSTDITERLNLEEQVRHAQKVESVGILAGGVSHDLNTVLTAILGFADLLEPQMPPEKQGELVREIIAAAERGAQVTRKLLAFSRCEPTRPEPVDLARVVEGMIRFLSRLMGPGHRLVTDRSTEPLTICGDAAQLEQVITNIVLNARDAMPEGGEIRISTTRTSVSEGAPPGTAAQGDYATLVVRDSGNGIPPEFREKIFEPFFTTKASGAGTGLGLAIVKGIVAQHGGFVAVESDGTGTSFFIHLPVAPVVENRPGVESPARPSTGTGRILVLEDDAANRSFFVAALTQGGYSVVAATTGEEALATLKNSPFDLILSDIHMPGMTGVAFQARAREMSPSIPFVFVSGCSFEQLPDRELYGAVIQKPVRAKALLERVGQVLGKTA